MNKQNIRNWWNFWRIKKRDFSQKKFGRFKTIFESIGNGFILRGKSINHAAQKCVKFMKKVNETRATRKYKQNSKNCSNLFLNSLLCYCYELKNGNGSFRATLEKRIPPTSLTITTVKQAKMLRNNAENWP